MGARFVRCILYVFSEIFVPVFLEKAFSVLIIVDLGPMASQRFYPKERFANVLKRTFSGDLVLGRMAAPVHQF